MYINNNRWTIKMIEDLAVVGFRQDSSAHAHYGKVYFMILQQTAAYELQKMPVVRQNLFEYDF